MSHCKHVISLITVGPVMLIELTIDRRICVSLDLALFSANSRVLMSFSLTLYLFICSQIISSTHLWRGSKRQTSVTGNFKQCSKTITSYKKVYNIPLHAVFFPHTVQYMAFLSAWVTDFYGFLSRLTLSTINEEISSKAGQTQFKSIQFYLYIIILYIFI